MTMSSVRQNTASAIDNSFLTSRGRSQLNIHETNARKSSHVKPKIGVQRHKPDQLSHDNQELLKRLLITISKGERSIERQRQVLAQLSRFEPHSAFQRIDRDQDSKLSSLELFKFLRDNGVEEATEADTHYIVKYFDSNEDDMLEYEDLLQMVMPCDNQYLRAAIAQRDIYEVSKHDYLDTNIEIELTRLFEKLILSGFREIALNRVIEELKQVIKATKSFCVNLAFQAIDDWKYGYIDKKNLKSFLRKHSYLASTAECMAIIRRLDLDADARLSKHEFAAGLQPEQPFNKAMKRTQMRRGTSSNAFRGNSRQSLSIKNGQILMLQNSQRSNLRTLAMDRQQVKKGLTKGTTPLKSRPSVTPNLNHIVSPATGGNNKKAFHSQKIPMHHHQPRQKPQPQHKQLPARSPQSARSRKSSTHRPKQQQQQHQPAANNNSTTLQQSSFMRRHASAIAGGRRKKDQKPINNKHHLQSQSKKKGASGRGEAYDDSAIDRLSRPVDHAKVKKRIERDQKASLKKQSSVHQRKASLQRSLSRSSMKRNNKENSNLCNDDDDKFSRRMVRKYKSFVSKLGSQDPYYYDRKEEQQSFDNDALSCRGLSSRRSTSKYNHEEGGGGGIDNRHLLLSYNNESSNMNESHRLQQQQQHSLRKKKSSADSRRKHSRNLSSGEAGPRQYLIARDQSKEPSQNNRASCTEPELEQIMVPVSSEPLRRPVLSNHRSDIASPKSILPREEENFFMHSLHEIMIYEKDLEAQKISLSRREDFNLIDAFGILDTDSKGNLNPRELHQALQKLNVSASIEDCYLLFHRMNREVDGLLKYSEFTSAFMPVDQYFARLLGGKRLQFCSPPSHASLCVETMHHYSEVWQLLVKIEQQVEVVRQKLASRPAFDFDQAFRSCDQSFSGQVTLTDIQNLMLEYGLHVSTEEIQLLIYRLDRDKDAQVNFLEFKQGLAPSRFYLYQNGKLNSDMSVLELQ